MAAIWLSGYEQGTTAGLITGASVNERYADRVVGTLGTNVEIVSAAARTGGYGLRLTPTSAIAYLGFYNAANSGILGSSGTLVGSFWFRFPTLPSNDFDVFIGIGTAGGNDFRLRYLNSTTGLQAILGSSTQLGPQITANTWVHCEFRLVLNANPHTLEWKINGVTQTQVNLSVASENLFTAGWSIDNGTQTGVLHVDDCVISLTSGDYPLGQQKVVQLIPDTAGTAALIAGAAANSLGRMVTNSAIDSTFNSANILAAVSEVPPTLGASASGLGQRTSGAGNACEVPMTTYTLTGGETVTAVRVNACTWSASTSANNLGLRAYNGSAETTLFAAAGYAGTNSSTAPAWICKMYTGVTDQTTLDALVVRVGYSSDINPLPGIHAAYAEVAVKEATDTYPYELLTPTPRFAA